MRGRGYPRAAAFITKHARVMVTFTELALEGVRIPYTTNRSERLMGEISPSGASTGGCTGQPWG